MTTTDFCNTCRITHQLLEDRPCSWPREFQGTPPTKNWKLRRLLTDTLAVCLGLIGFVYLMVDAFTKGR